jgi:hypothetical protein
MKFFSLPASYGGGGGVALGLLLVSVIILKIVEIYYVKSLMAGRPKTRKI